MKRFVWTCLFVAGCAAGGAAPQQPSVSPGGQQQPGDVAPAMVETNRARAELKQAEAELEAAQGNCASACKALASMERATDHLCGVVTPEEQRVCEDARKKLASSRERVRAECGECTK